MLTIERPQTSPPSDLEPRAGTPGIDPSAMIDLVSAVMDRIECGVLACGPQGELYYANNAAYRELAGTATLHLVDGHVCCTEKSQPGWARAVHAAAVRLRSSLVCLEGAGERMMVALMPVHAGDDRPAAVAMMGRRAVCSPLGLEMLSNNHGLTFAERRVLRALIGNCTPREIAASHGVTLATIRSHILAVRDKLGVRSIDALLLRAAEVPPITARF